MYQWYQNSKVCYAYLHNIPGASFPTESDKEKYHESNGWPEWFSHGWTLQEMIALENVQFFNQDWQSIGDKRTLACTLEEITQVPSYILTDGLSTYRPCIAQIMSWAADRKTTRVKDRAYSLLGLLDVNMPMLYGEGNRAFQRLQLEIIRVSDDQSISAWGAGDDGDGGWTGSILADDPSFFWDCGNMESINRDEFIREVVKNVAPEEELHSIEDHFGVFPVTNRGIQIWMLLRPLENSDSVFEAWLPCLDAGDPVRINLVLWDSNYYRYYMQGSYTKRTAQFCQVYLRYQDPPHSDVTFEIDDSNTLTLTNTDPLHQMGFGQCLGQDWMHVIFEQPTKKGQLAHNPYIAFHDMLSSGPDYAKFMAETRRFESFPRVWVKHVCFPGSTWTIRTSCIVWHSSRNRGVKIEVFRHPFSGPEKWISFPVDGADNSNCDMQNLMISQISLDAYWLEVNGFHIRFSRAPDGTKGQLGDYGYLTDCEDFCCEGNIFDDLRSLPSKPVVTPKKDRPKDDTNSDGCVTAFNLGPCGDFRLYDPVMLSLPSNDDVNTLLASLSTRFINRYLINRVIECPPVPPDEFSSSTMLYRSSDGSTTLNSMVPLCNFVTPFVWYRREAVDSGSGVDMLSSEDEHDGANSA
ncbi:hypothetical protein V8B97DRAFT_2047969 [Scleroderma yunnanense]